MNSDYDLFSLPEDPELAFVEFERRLHRSLDENTKGQDYGPYVMDQKIYYVAKLMAFHDAHQLNLIKNPYLDRYDDDFMPKFDKFLIEVMYYTTLIEVRHASRLRPISTIVVLTDDIRRQIHSYIDKIREAIQPLHLKPQKKEVLFRKLNALADEVDRDRTKTEAWTAFFLEVASAGTQATKELESARKWMESIGNLLGKAKELADRLGLPSPAERKRLEGPKKQLPPPDKSKTPSSEFDDDIPF